jgi:nicotinamidase-related amidase
MMIAQGSRRAEEESMFHPTQMSSKDTGLLVIDVQEKLMAKIPRAAEIVRNIAFLSDAAKALGMPAQATEQYPKGLGGSVADIVQRYPDRPDKLGFSCCAIPQIVETFRTAARPKLVLTGIEAHVCVLHTALDLVALDFRVYIATDAIGSRYDVDLQTALKRMARAGCILVTSEMAAFEWVGGADHPQFKVISGLIQQRMKTT